LLEAPNLSAPDLDCYAPRKLDAAPQSPTVHTKHRRVDTRL